MDYLEERVADLTKEADGLELDERQHDFVVKLLGMLKEMAVIIDDAVDAVDELDMRLLEIEQEHGGN